MRYGSNMKRQVQKAALQSSRNKLGGQAVAVQKQDRMYRPERDGPKTMVSGSSSAQARPALQKRPSRLKASLQQLKDAPAAKARAEQSAQASPLAITNVMRKRKVM